VRRYEKKEFGLNTKLIGICKEIAPTADGKVRTDEELGVNEYQMKYFGGLPLYVDDKKSFYDAFGRNYISLGYNPFNWLWLIFKAFGIICGNVSGNLAGEGVILGGILVIQPPSTKNDTDTPSLVYSIKESMADHFDYGAIAKAANTANTANTANAAAAAVASSTVETEGNGECKP